MKRTETGAYRERISILGRPEFFVLFFKEADNVEEAATAESQSCPGVGDESKERKDRRNGVRMREKTSLKGTE